MQVLIVPFRQGFCEDFQDVTQLSRVPNAPQENNHGHYLHFNYAQDFRRKGFPGGSDGKVSACNEGDPGLIPGSGRSPREGNGNPLQHSCLENPMDGGA